MGVERRDDDIKEVLEGGGGRVGAEVGHHAGEIELLVGVTKVSCDLG